jgi:hypothetical protein
VGAGFAVLVDIVTGHADIAIRGGDIAVAVPLAVYMAGLWFIRDRFAYEGLTRFVLLLFAALILTAGFFLPAALELMAALSIASVWVRSYLATRERRRMRRI